jgi:hypothetical protein
MSLIWINGPRMFPAPVEIRPHVCAALAAGLADKSIFNIGQLMSSGQPSPLIAIEWLQPIQELLVLERRLRAGLDASYGRLDRAAQARTIFHMQHILDQHVSGAPFRTEFPHGLVRDGERCEHHNHGYRGGASLEETPTEGPTRL